MTERQRVRYLKVSLREGIDCFRKIRFSSAFPPFDWVGYNRAMENYHYTLRLRRHLSGSDKDYPRCERNI
jgi:hypothetical protein